MRYINSRFTYLLTYLLDLFKRRLKTVLFSRAYRPMLALLALLDGFCKWRYTNPWMMMMMMIYRPLKMEGWVSPGPGCKEQLAHGCYTKARRQRALNLLRSGSKSSTLTTRISRHPWMLLVWFTRLPSVCACGSYHCAYGSEGLKVTLIYKGGVLVVYQAAKSLCMWVRAVDLYAHVYRTVQPKREKYNLYLFIYLWTDK